MRWEGHLHIRVACSPTELVILHGSLAARSLRLRISAAYSLHGTGQEGTEMSTAKFVIAGGNPFSPRCLRASLYKVKKLIVGQTINSGAGSYLAWGLEVRTSFFSKPVERN